MAGRNDPRQMVRQQPGGPSFEQIMQAILTIAPGSGDALAMRDAGNASGQVMQAIQAGQPLQAATSSADMLTALLGAIPGIGGVVRGVGKVTKGGLRLLQGGGATSDELNKLTDLVNRLDMKTADVAFNQDRAAQLLDLSTKRFPGGVNVSDASLKASVGQERFGNNNIFDEIGSLLQADVTSPGTAVKAIRAKQTEVKAIQDELDGLMKQLTEARSARKGMVEKKHADRIARVKASEAKRGK